MKPLLRPCLDCNRLHTNTSRCGSHQQAKRQRYNTAYSDPEYKRNRRILLDDHIARHGWICPGATDLDHEPHPSTDLTADHIIPTSEGGTHALDNLRVLCRRMNTSKGGSNRRRADR